MKILKSSSKLLLCYRTIAILIAMVLLTGCKLDNYVELYVGDVIDSFQGDLSSQGKLTVFMPSGKQCKENKDKVIQIISRYMEKIKDEGCKNKGMDDFLVLGVSYPVSSKESNSLFSIFVSGNESSPSVFLKLDREKFDRLNSEIKAEFRDDIDLDKSRIIINLVNDQRKTVEVKTGSVFLDTVPVLFGNVKLNKRKSIHIKFSNVHSVFFEKNNEVKLFQLNL